MFGKNALILPNIGKFELGRGGRDGVFSGKAFLTRIPMMPPSALPHPNGVPAETVNGLRPFVPWQVHEQFLDFLP